MKDKVLSLAIKGQRVVASGGPVRFCHSRLGWALHQEPRDQAAVRLVPKA